MKKTVVAVTTIAAVFLISAIVFLARFQRATALTQAELKPAGYEKRMAPPQPPEACMYRTEEVATLERTEKSTAPLTEDEIAIYRLVLDNWRSDREMLNVSNRTFPLDFDSHGETSCECLKGIDVESAVKASHSYRTLPVTVLSGKGMRLVDSRKQMQEARANDPEVGMGNKKSVHEAVKAAMNAGLFGVSEIAFDKQHTHAWVSFTFWCGMLCGHGATVVFEKDGTQWKQADRSCPGYVS